MGQYVLNISEHLFDMFIKKDQNYPNPPERVFLIRALQEVHLFQKYLETYYISRNTVYSKNTTFF